MTAVQQPFEEALADLIRVLDSQPFPYCLLGALALGAWGIPRTTQDVDVLSVLHRRRGTLDTAYRSSWAQRLGVQEELAYCLTWRAGRLARPIQNPSR